MGQSTDKNGPFKMIVVGFSLLSLLLGAVFGIAALTLSTAAMNWDHDWNSKLMNMSLSNPQSLSPGFQEMFTNPNLSSRILLMLQRESPLGWFVFHLKTITTLCDSFILVASIIWQLCNCAKSAKSEKARRSFWHTLFVWGIAASGIFVVVSCVLEMMSIAQYEQNAEDFDKILVKSSHFHWPCAPSVREHYEGSRLSSVPFLDEENASLWGSGYPHMCQFWREKCYSGIFLCLHFMFVGSAVAIIVYVFDQSGKDRKDAVGGEEIKMVMMSQKV